MALTLFFDIGTSTLALAAAYIFRWWSTAGFPEAWPSIVLVSCLLFAGSTGMAFYLTGVHRQVWRHMGANDAVRLVQAVALSMLIYLPLQFLLNRLDGIPRSGLLIAAVLWVGLLFAGRMVALSRSTHMPFQLFRRVQKDAPPAVLIGDLESVAMALHGLQTSPEGANVRVLGIAQTDFAQPGRAVRGVAVMGGVQDLEMILGILEVRYGEVPWVAVTGDARMPAIMNEILEIAAEKKTKIMALGSKDASPRLHDLRTSDLLARPKHELDMTAAARLISGKRVLVTGGGGTIGLELARQCAALQPAQLSILDASEYNVYRANLSLRREYRGLPLNAVLGDVRDATRVDELFRQIRPEIVLHAAALKHVPLMEQHVCEAILTNVAGATNIARAASAVGTERMVFISTDKAVDPDNVMGATKRLAEIAVARVAKQSGLTPSLVRFGNVLGSSGSVVPLFKEQIEAGGPVTVTHPDVSRYFMTVDEAASLTLQAAALQQPSAAAKLFVLDMGEPIKIHALAEAMIRMQGKVPGVDVEIEYTGLRPGEKLHEALVYDHEKISRTEIEGILEVAGVNGVDDSFDLTLASLVRAASKRDRVEALALLGRLVPEYGARVAVDRREAAGA
ncbi:MAG: nucleoside-diphosphate sugar epimerase/dehydratase [Pseudomonadota bacterium]